MLYSQEKNTIKNGDLLIWNNSPIINFFTRSTYSHVGLALWIGKRLFVLEADIPEVRLYPLSNKSSFYIIKGVAPDWNDEVTDFALEFIGNRYSIFDAVRSLFMPLKVDGAWQCVEYAKFIYRKMGIELNDVYLPREIVKEFLDKGFDIDYINNDLYTGRLKPKTNIFADFSNKVQKENSKDANADDHPIVEIVKEITDNKKE